jgi:hypothetical protein
VAAAISDARRRTLLATKAKGIYKPQWSPYALSVRQSLGGPYADREPVLRADGSWLYSYFQENTDLESRDDEYTNRALLECIRDSVPVGVFRQIRSKPNSVYYVLGIALVTGFDAGYFFFEGFSAVGNALGAGAPGEMEFLGLQSEGAAQAEGAFDPKSVIDARERTAAQIVRRRGQPAFRRALISAYEGCCAISACDAEEALEAAHIVPYRGSDTNRVENGLLLRADLHLLFDLGLIAVDPTDMTVVIAPAIIGTIYANLAGSRLHLPRAKANNPSIAALEAHLQWSGLSLRSCRESS